MIETLRRLFGLLSARERRAFWILAVLIVIETLVEMLGVALIPLYISALAYPERLLTHPGVVAHVPAAWLAWLDREQLIFWGGCVLLAYFAIKSAYVIFANYWKASFAQNRARKLAARLLRAYLNAPFSFHLRHHSAELLRNVSQEATQVANRVLIPLIEFFSHAAVLAGIVLVLLLVLDATILLWLAAFLSLGFACAFFMQRRLRSLGRSAQHQRMMVQQVGREALIGVREIRLLRRTGYFVQQLTRSLSLTFRIQRFVQVLRRAIPTVIEFIGIAGLIGVTVMMLFNDAETPEIVAALSVFAVAMSRMKSAVRGLIDTTADLRHHSVALEAVADALDELEPLVAAELAKSDAPLPLTRTIRFEGVSFRHEGADRDSLQNVDLEIRRGESVGFVGTTGAGKSTLANLLLGVLTPTTGRILVDDTDIAERPAGWQRQIGYIPQEVFLRDASLADNIALGLPREEIDAGRLEAALSAAELAPLRDRLPEGIDTRVGEHGIRLSGGERQRIAIARALYGDPDVLVMDEATSALDATTEAAVIDSVNALKGARTLVMVAHRLTTVRRCDRIVVLEQGRIEAIGSYDELREQHAGFRRMTES